MINVNHVQKNVATNVKAVRQDVPKGQNAAQPFSTFLNAETMKPFLSHIDELFVKGKELAERRTLKELNAFRNKLKACLNYLTSEGFELKQSVSTAAGGFKRHQTVKVIDQELKELANDVFNSQKTKMDLLNRVGELKGLLIELYA